MKIWGVVVVLFWAGMAAAQDADARRIVVIGQGVGGLAHDVAELRIGIEREAGSAAEALGDLSAELQTVMLALQGAQIAQTQIATSQLTLFERQDAGGGLGSLPGQVSYVASSVLNVTTQDLEGIGVLLDVAVANGANRIEGVRFEVRDPAAALDAARRLAVADGTAKAQVLAAAAGVTLGDLMVIRDGPREGAGFGAIARMSVPIAPGSADISVAVEMVFAING